MTNYDKKKGKFKELCENNWRIQFHLAHDVRAIIGGGRY